MRSCRHRMGMAHASWAWPHTILDSSRYGHISGVGVSDIRDSIHRTHLFEHHVFRVFIFHVLLNAIRAWLAYVSVCGSCYVPIEPGPNAIHVFALGYWVLKVRGGGSGPVCIPDIRRHVRAHCYSLCPPSSIRVL